MSGRNRASDVSREVKFLFNFNLLNATCLSQIFRSIISVWLRAANIGAYDVHNS